MHKKPWLNVDDYLQYQPPNTDRSTWTKSNEFMFGSSSFGNKEWPKREFDESKCPVCGGSGRTWLQKSGSKNERRQKKTNVRCPANCKWAYDF